MVLMESHSLQQRRQLQSLDRGALEAHQLEQLNAMLAEILPQNAFYAKQLAGVRRPIAALAELADWPFTLKDELLPAAGQRFAANLTYPPERYCRLHQTSGTRGRPLVVLDTAADWRWFCEGWQYVLDSADVQTSDVAFMAFSFGPFIAFWSAHAALVDRGCLVVPGGGLSTLGRIDLLQVSRATLLFCTPTYALHLAEVAAQNQIDLRQTAIRCLLLAGEPGASIPSVRAQIEHAWDAQVLDHSGATEVGPWGVGQRDGSGIRVTESQFIAEFIKLDGSGPAADGELSELVLTNLGRHGCPVIRYKTGDLVRPNHGLANDSLATQPASAHSAQPDSNFVMLTGGVLGRVDDMLIIRGVNVFPSAIEQVIRDFAEVSEFRMTATRQQSMDQLSVEIEDALDRPQRVADALRTRLGLRIEVRSLPAGSLPRFEGKGQRFVDNRGQELSGMEKS